MWKWLQCSSDLTGLLAWHRRYIEKHSPIKGTKPIGSRRLFEWSLSQEPRAYYLQGSLQESVLSPREHYNQSNTALSCASGAIAVCTTFTNYWALQESLSMMPKTRHHQLSFTVLFSTLHSPFLQSSSHLSPYQHTMTFFTPKQFFFYPSDFTKIYQDFTLSLSSLQS